MVVEMRKRWYTRERQWWCPGVLVVPRVDTRSDETQHGGGEQAAYRRHCSGRLDTVQPQVQSNLYACVFQRL